MIVSAVPGAGLLPGPALGVRAAAEVLVSGLGPAGAACREPGLCNDHVDLGTLGLLETTTDLDTLPLDT